MNRQEILDKAKAHLLKEEKVYVIDWDTEVLLKELSGRLYLDISDDCLIAGEIDKKKFLNYAIIASVHDLEGKKIFGIDDIDTIMNMTAEGYSALVMAITKLNNLDEAKNTSKNSKKAT